MYKVTIETTQQPLTPSSPTAAPLLSELFIQLPKPQPTKKINNTQSIDPPEQWEQKASDRDNPPLKSNDSHCFIFSGTRTKNSSASLPFKSESEIISQWVRNLFQKRGLLGPNWQIKLSQKRKILLKTAFTSLKEYEPKQPSTYLQTQSRYKPYLKKCNQLLILGIDKLQEIIPRVTLRSKQEAFSKILRFLAFMHMNSLTRSKSNSNSLQNSLRQSNNTLSPRNNHLIIRQDYELQLTNRHNIRQVQSTKQLPNIDNQYALTPFAPPTLNNEAYCKYIHPQPNMELYQEQLTRSPRSSRYVPYITQANNLVDSLNRGEPTQIKFGYDLPRESQHCFANPPSPKAHQFQPVPSPMTAFPQSLQFQPQPLTNTINLSSRTDNIRSSTHLRPHSHNPFANKSLPKDPSFPKQAEKGPESRSRAVSASPNIKISFMGVQTNNQQMERRIIPNDYEGEQNIKRSNMYKLGTAENKQMRQSYQVNSLQNQLIPQDYNRNLYTPTPLYSQPMTPMTPQIMHSPVSRGIHLSPKTPMSPMSPMSPRMAPSSPNQVKFIVGRQGPRSPRQMDYRSSNRLQPNDYNMKKRQKLTVTASRRKH